MLQLLALAVLVSLSGWLSGCGKPVVEVPGLGSLRGAVLQKKVAVFRGIPYAKPPLHDLRWRPPQPHGPWGGGRFFGVRDAAHYRDACIPKFYSPKVSVSEDCLFLNVATPLASLKSGASLPVMVYIHGGAYRSGASQNLDQASLVIESDASVVLVNFNYRLNVFGFLGSHELRDRSPDHSTGNYGIQDQQLALVWVQDHISSFGGNSLEVTIFGESAGGNAVMVHLTQPASFALYKRAAVQSGGYLNAAELQEAEASYLQVLKKTGCHDVDCLVNSSAEALSDVLETVVSWGPTVDGVFLLASPQRLITLGKYNKKAPVLIGSNRDEAALFMDNADQFPPNLTQDTFDALFWAVPQFSDNITEVKRLYRPSFYKYPSNLGNFSRWWWELMRVATEIHDERDSRNQPAMGLGHCSVRCLARAFQRGGTPQVFTYLFSHPSQTVLPDVNEGYDLFGTGPGSVLVPHASELPYVFGMFNILGKEGEEADLARDMSRYWLQFMRSGNPNRAGLPPWPSYHAGNDSTLVLDSGVGAIQPISEYNAAQCDFFDSQPHSFCQLESRSEQNVDQQGDKLSTPEVPRDNGSGTSHPEAAPEMPHATQFSQPAMAKSASEQEGPSSVSDDRPDVIV